MCTATVLQLSAAPEWRVTVDAATAIGPIKRMNAVNNGPSKARTNETKPESYDFTLTDEYLENMRKAGTEPYYCEPYEVAANCANARKRLGDNGFTKTRCHLTDAVRTYTETPLVPNDDGTATLKLQPMKDIPADLDAVKDCEYVRYGNHEQYFFKDYLAYQSDYMEKEMLVARMLKAQGRRFVFPEEIV